jgi:transcriptional regulator with XRE-family HTH domain
MTTETLFYKRFNRLIRLSGKSVNQVERELGYSRNTLHNYKDGTMPSGTRLIEIANYFGVSPNYLIEENSQVRELSLQNFFNQLHTEQKYELATLCHEWLILDKLN